MAGLLDLESIFLQMTKRLWRTLGAPGVRILEGWPFERPPEQRGRHASPLDLEPKLAGFAGWFWYPPIKQ